MAASTSFQITIWRKKESRIMTVNEYTTASSILSWVKQQWPPVNPNAGTHTHKPAIRTTNYVILDEELPLCIYGITDGTHLVYTLVRKPTNEKDTVPLPDADTDGSAHTDARPVPPPRT